MTTPPIILSADIRHAQNAMDKFMDQLIEPSGCDFMQWHVLSLIGVGGPTNVEALAAKVAGNLKISVADALGLLARLTERGLIERCGDDELSVAVTDVGEATFRPIHDRAIGVRARVYCDLSPDDEAATHRVLVTLTERFEAEPREAQAMPDRPLTGQAAIVTGGGGGIGAACAAWLARDGAAVTIVGRTEATLLRACDAITDFAGRDASVDYFVGDATDAASLAEATRSAAARADRLSMAVAVVGGEPTFKPLIMFDPDEALAGLGINVVPNLVLIKAVVPEMVAGGGGSIVCISSQVASLAWPFLTMYSASKCAVEGLVRGAALELAHLNIRVNAVRPGLVETDATRPGPFRDQTVLAQFVAEMPLGRAGLPDDVAPAVRYLAGPESSWVTGQSFGVDGGHELTKAPYLESVVRRIHGDEAIDAALAGKPH